MKKFRAWFENSQTWVYFTMGEIWTDQGIKIYERIILDGGKFYQCFGIHDVYNDELYEGDIVHVKYYENKNDVIQYTIEDIRNIPDIRGSNKNFEIVGNIHEHKHLLK